MAIHKPRVHVHPLYGPPHDTDGGPCWCEPKEEEHEHGVVVIHREPAN